MRFLNYLSLLIFIFIVMSFNGYSALQVKAGNKLVPSSDSKNSTVFFEQLSPSSRNRLQVKETPKVIKKKVRLAVARQARLFLGTFFLPLLVLVGNMPAISADPVVSPIMDNAASAIKNKATRRLLEPEAHVSKHNPGAELLEESKEIFDTYERLIGEAEHEVIMAAFVWVAESDQSSIELGQSAEAESIHKIGRGLIKATKRLESGKQLKVSILADRSTFLNFFGARIKSEPELEWPATIKIWKAMGLELDKIDFELKSFESLAAGNFHSKYLIVDGEHLVVGSANIQPENNDHKNGMRETAVYVSGEIARKLREYHIDFVRTQRILHWNCNIEACAISEQETTLLKNHEWILAKSEEEADGFDTIVLDQLPEEIGETLSPQTAGIIAAVDSAKKSIDLINPNISGKVFVDALERAILRGVKVRIVASKGKGAELYRHLPGYGSNQQVSDYLHYATDGFIANPKDKLEMRWFRPSFVAKSDLPPPAGSGASINHSKAMMIDNEALIIGSTNYEFFAMVTSAEMALLLIEPQLIEDFSVFFEGRWNDGIPVTRTPYSSYIPKKVF